jgi:hypothetical protein
VITVGLGRGRRNTRGSRHAVGLGEDDGGTRGRLVTFVARVLAKPRACRVIACRVIVRGVIVRGVIVRVA